MRDIRQRPLSDDLPTEEAERRATETLRRLLTTPKPTKKTADGKPVDRAPPASKKAPKKG
jgi:hypothetical protein